jgi:hypothetical protein
MTDKPKSPIAWVNPSAKSGEPFNQIPATVNGREFQGMTVVQMKERAKELIADWKRLVAKVKPSAVRAAVREREDMVANGMPARYLPTIDDLILKGRDSVAQSKRGKGRKTPEDDPLDAIIKRGRTGGLTAKEICRLIEAEAPNTDRLEIEIGKNG